MEGNPGNPGTRYLLQATEEQSRGPNTGNKYRVPGFRAAASAYARAVGVPTETLGAEIFAAHPVVVKIGGDLYVRSIQQMNPDGSLTFYCAIDEGIILTLATGTEARDHVEELFRGIREKIGRPELVLGCDCILRNLEFQKKGTREDVARVLQENSVVGFSTYGEQFQGMHVNQTITGVAIGSGEDSVRGA